MFYGFLSISKGTPKTVSCTAYDQLLYLKAQDFVVRKGETLDAFLKRLCSIVMTRISLGTIESTGTVLSDCPFDGKGYLDMVYESIKETTYLNGSFYALRDEYGALTLREVLGLRLPLIIGDGSYAVGYSYERSISKDTYNVIKVVKDNADTGIREATVAQDSETIGRWGKLQLYHKASDCNEAQMQQLAANLLLLKDRETETLSIDCIGDLRVRAGTGVKVQIKDAGVDLWAIVNKAVHSFNGASHTMKLDMKYGRWATWLA